MSTLPASSRDPGAGWRRVSKHQRLGITIMGGLTALVLVVLVAPLVLPPRQQVASSWPSTTWETAAPEEQGLDSAKLADALEEMQSRNLRIHSLTLIRNGYLLLDANFYPYDGSQPHNMASVTKTITATLISIAADQGKLRLDQPVLSFFPERSVANRDSRKERMTVRDLVSMSSGLECLGPPDYPDEPTLWDMEASSDFVQFTLDLPMATDPGTTWSYCSPGTHLLSAILTRATGMTELDFARENLFEPIGIHDVIWPADAQGITHGWGDAYLYPHDAAKLGYLWLRGGFWYGRRVVSQGWLEDSIKVHTSVPGDQDYGYGWWIDRDGEYGQFAAQGRGGQRILVLPTINAIVVTTGGGLDSGEATDLLAPAVVDVEHPLAANPAGVARLEEAIVRVASTPTPAPVPPLPETARLISGRTYTFEPNPLLLDTMTLDFTRPGDPSLRLTFTGAPPRESMVGLDGVLRMSPGENGLPIGERGYWQDESTFIVDYDQIANIDPFVLQARFEANSVIMDARDRTRMEGVRLVGHTNDG